jgi:PilZ domain
MDPEIQAPRAAPAKVDEEHRRYARHRYIEGVYIGEQDGTWSTAMTYEISVGGLSAATTTPLAVGETVHLSPVVGKPVEAIVRRKQGAMYGFEFIGLPPKVFEQLQKLCEGLPLFQSMIDV